MSARRIALAVLAATALAYVIATHGWLSFAATRVKILRAPEVVAGGAVSTTVFDDSRARALRVPFAVIWGAENPSDGPVTLSLAIDGRAICTEVVPSQSLRPRRLECVAMAGAQWDPGLARHTVTVAGGVRPWSLESLEFAAHFGRSTGPADFFVLPRASTNFGRLTPVWIATIWCALVAGFLVSPRSVDRGIRTAHRLLSWIVILGLVAAVVAPWVTSYNVIVSTGTFARAIAVLLFLRLWTAAAWMWTTGGRLLRPISHPILVHLAAHRPAVIGLGAIMLVASGYGRVVAYDLGHDYHGNYSGFLRIGWMFDHNPVLPDPPSMRSEVLVEDTGGYDGQFMYFMTFDPFLRRFHDRPEIYRHVVDAAPYRYGRIGLSLLTKIGSLDHWQWYPAATTWIILVSLVAGAVALALLADRNGASPGWGAALLLVPGFWLSVRTGLPEPVAAAFVIAGFLCLSTDRWVAAALLCACALLVRETSAVFVLCVGGWTWFSGTRRRAVEFIGLAFVPIVLWRLYVGATLYPNWGLQAYLFDPHDLGLPFAGFADLWARLAHGEYFPGSADMARAAITYPILLIAGLLFGALALVVQPSATALAAVAYGTVAMLLNYQSIWVHVGNGQRGTFELFVMLALTSVGLKDANRGLRMARMSFWVLAAGYVLFGSFEAPWLRQALLPGIWGQ
jgi:hypothetical protein